MLTLISSPTPLTVTVTAPPATEPSTVVSLRRAWASSSCSCICWACWSRAFMSKPPPPRASKGFWLMGCSLSALGSAWVVRDGGGWRSRVPDLLDHLRAELAAEQLGGAHALVVGVDVVGMGLGVDRRPVGPPGSTGLVGVRGPLDAPPGRGDRLGVRGAPGRLGCRTRRRA